MDDYSFSAAGCKSLNSVKGRTLYCAYMPFHFSGGDKFKSDG